MTDPARGRQVRRQELRASPVVCTASASPSSTRCRSGSTSASGATAPSGPSSYDLAKPGPLEKVGPTKKQGTEITFWADGDIFETTHYSFDTISRRLQEMAFLNKGLTIVLRDERPGHSKVETGMAEEITLAEAAPVPGAEDEAFEATEITYKYDGGLEDYVTHINAKKSPIHKSIVSFSADGVGKNDMAM